MKNKGYTIIEAVVAMFLVVIMVGAVFSALMSGRRAIIASSEKEEILYSLHSAYTLLKDCRNNPNCHLAALGCSYILSFGMRPQDLKPCDDLFTFNFKNLCKNDTEGVLRYLVTSEEVPPQVSITKFEGGGGGMGAMAKLDLYALSIEANCSES